MWRNKLLKAFKYWHEGGTKKVRHKKKMIMDGMEAENQVIEDQVKKVNEKIQQQNVRSINKGNVRANKIMKKMYLKQIGKWFNIWHNQMKHFEHKGNKMEKAIINKL